MYAPKSCRHLNILPIANATFGKKFNSWNNHVYKALPLSAARTHLVPKVVCFRQKRGHVNPDFGPTTDVFLKQVI